MPAASSVPYGRATCPREEPGAEAGFKLTRSKRIGLGSSGQNDDPRPRLLYARLSYAPTRARTAMTGALFAAGEIPPIIMVVASSKMAPMSARLLCGWSAGATGVGEDGQRDHDEERGSRHAGSGFERCALYLTRALLERASVGLICCAVRRRPILAGLVAPLLEIHQVCLRCSLLARPTSTRPQTSRDDQSD